jgi:hypothetical protein
VPCTSGCGAAASEGEGDFLAFSSASYLEVQAKKASIRNAVRKVVLPHITNQGVYGEKKN